jgi:hypothetical protein
MQDLQTPHQPHLLCSSYNMRACLLSCACSRGCGRPAPCTVCRPASCEWPWGSPKYTLPLALGKPISRDETYTRHHGCLIRFDAVNPTSACGYGPSKINRGVGEACLPWATRTRDPASPDRPRSGPAALQLTPKGHCEQPFVSQSSCTGQQAMLSCDLMRTAQVQANTLRLPHTCKDQDYQMTPIIKIQL